MFTVFLLSSTLMMRSPATAPTWSKAGVSLDVDCAGAPSGGVQRIESPDRQKAVVFLCRAPGSDAPLRLRIERGADGVHEIDVHHADDVWRPEELVWAPDSSGFLINGGASAYAGFSVIVYVLRPDGVASIDLTRAAQRDMARAFPPCRAQGLSEADCKMIEQSADFNMSAITWTGGGSSLIVVGEIPCSSSFGGIMCQVMGYEIDVPTGRILRRMSARELKRRYQGEMAWDLRIPPRLRFR